MGTKKENTILSCFDVANYFLVLVDREAGDYITQLNLQKLVYFAQGINIALFNEPLFNDSIEVWGHKPIARSLCTIFGNFKDSGIPAPSEIDFEIYKQQQKELIYKVYSVYVAYTTSYLRGLPYKHVSWYEAIISSDKVITQKKMQEFFKANIKDVKDDFLVISKEDIKNIENAEDQWWMSYDSGIPADDITSEIIESKKRAKRRKKD